MVSQRRKLTPFSLSFLDIMSCGFGAVILLFLIIKHNVDANTPIVVATPDLRSEVTLLEEEIVDGDKDLAKIRNTISERNDELALAQGLARRIMEEVDSAQSLAEELVPDTADARLKKLKADIIRLETEKQQIIRDITKSGEDIRKFAGDGNRAYVTGLQLGGNYMLILLDVSASMLDSSIVNVLRRRNMRDERKRTAPKWVKTLDIVKWLSAKFPLNGHFQLYTFNDQTRSAVADTDGRWLEVRDKIQLKKAVDHLEQIVPEKGTNLELALAAVGRLRPLPDNVYLITDGLPTRSSRPSRGATISGSDRLRAFASAIKKLPKGVPINVILAPMEGDPEAARAFWLLSQNTRGSFMSPAKDWP